MSLDADQPWRATALAQRLLEPETPEEVAGIAPNVIFPTAIEEVDESPVAFYEMADNSIGVARSCAWGES